jgi:hypothetical protein
MEIGSRSAVSSSMNAWIQMFTRFVQVMFGARHTVSWNEGDWTRGERKGKYFLYFTVDEEAAAKAKDALENAGVLCHEILDGPQRFSAEEE